MGLAVRVRFISSLALSRVEPVMGRGLHLSDMEETNCQYRKRNRDVASRRRNSAAMHRTTAGVDVVECCCGARSVAYLPSVHARVEEKVLAGIRAVGTWGILGNWLLEIGRGHFGGTLQQLAIQRRHPLGTPVDDGASLPLSHGCQVRIAGPHGVGVGVKACRQPVQWENSPEETPQCPTCPPKPGNGKVHLPLMRARSGLRLPCLCWANWVPCTLCTRFRLGDANVQ